MTGHGYRYTGKGERFRAVPPRDLTQDFYDNLSPLDQRTVLTSGAYEPMGAAEAKKAEEAAKKAAMKAAESAGADTDEGGK